MAMKAVPIPTEEIMSCMQQIPYNLNNNFDDTTF